MQLDDTQVEAIRTKCHKRLLDTISTDTVHDIYAVADSTHDDTLRSASVEYTARPLNRCAAGGFHQLLSVLISNYLLVDTVACNAA